MAEASVEAGSGTVRFGAVVRAESVRRAVAIAKAGYPGAGVRVVHPVESEAFCVRDVAAPAGLGSRC